MVRWKALCILVAAATLSACGGKQKVAAPGTATHMNLTDEGLEGLDEATAINGITLQKAFPELQVDTGGLGRRYALRANGETLAVVEPRGEVGYRAKVLSSGVAGPRGVRVGDDFAAIVRFDELQCRRGAGEWASQIYCTTPDLPRIVFGFDGARVDTGSCEADCRLPDENALQGTPIRMIDWE